MVNYSEAVVATGLVIRRGRVEVLHGIDVHVPSGQIVGLLGPSGSGKTTLMRTIVGAQRITAGEVRVLGRPAGERSLRSAVGYMSQSPAIYDDLTVEQNLDYFRRVLRAPRADVARVIQEVGLGEVATRMVANLSGGQRSRVSLGIALLGTPRLLVLDEPTVGLDPALRQELWELFRRLADSGATLLVSSHVMDEARRCDRLLLVRDGRIVADDTPSGLLTATGATDHDDAFLRIIAHETEAAA
ncbi:ABC transporter ATP-binding protein [Homoserinibacter sp. GY 40078]|uniref:ABC transporter ATP-binding protein n=1 Tax=Homoserinibacter sp. GY 40078 TaxID=2603275 RepID=UPI0011C9B8AF|nr:ABC transporter ATP-binding protein [Homoserinibacter sp. GY 40078]TXK19545.1 ABC transporter ATP-binding protein [Homoserinibacter sp. GY 40078]